MKKPILDVYFFKTEAGNEPVRQWLQLLSPKDKKVMGKDIKTIQFGWPLGMPLARHIDSELWEVRSRLSNGIARILFLLDGNSMVLIHGFIKKQQKTPKPDLDLARTRVKQLRRGL
ncbi:type II toxin-antitoxin system RelE/ParE family toxin [Polynucleobacter sp. AP-Kolm-20A-A1]|uniref:type II toxin-antitoxin system RelE/ParE family toxin n=1 Tax=Polynucleobacter sp. AP-Kolm-20A-A1 TaxID=2081041 RepID=UPI001BFE1356|nr:type II toxin-antitoxin system RelE/ParE family toxin [Polynucleobacter sp. AP-Kolm-20A-A1]QWE21248.1 type II toxin-antitoxin system RelE/ParE family toxin [Polynucleobacter sp. AP-Kolm-20A-A1]